MRHRRYLEIQPETAQCCDLHSFVGVPGQPAVYQDPPKHSARSASKASPALDAHYHGQLAEATVLKRENTTNCKMNCKRDCCWRRLVGQCFEKLGRRSSARTWEPMIAARSLCWYFRGLAAIFGSCAIRLSKTPLERDCRCGDAAPVAPASAQIAP